MVQKQTAEVPLKSFTCASDSLVPGLEDFCNSVNHFIFVQVLEHKLSKNLVCDTAVLMCCLNIVMCTETRLKEKIVRMAGCLEKENGH